VKKIVAQMGTRKYNGTYSNQSFGLHLIQSLASSYSYTNINGISHHSKITTHRISTCMLCMGSLVPRPALFSVAQRT